VQRPWLDWKAKVKMAAPFRPGDKVIWLKCVSGEFVFPVTAKVLDVTEKRVKIKADDKERVQGPTRSGRSR
jgi:hypothetical protein